MRKIKKCKTNADNIIFKLEKNPDIIKYVSHHQNRPKVVVGFAAETENLMKCKIKTK